MSEKTDKTTGYIYSNSTKSREGAGTAPGRRKKTYYGKTPIFDFVEEDTSDWKIEFMGDKPGYSLLDVRAEKDLGNGQLA
jgi:hypothetical protein